MNEIGEVKRNNKIIGVVTSDEIFAVCKECRHFHNDEPHSPRKDVWYNHRCKACPLPVERDPYDGKLKPYGHNSFGMKYFEEDRRWEYCRDVNKDGKCGLFEGL